MVQFPMTVGEWKKITEYIQALIIRRYVLALASRDRVSSKKKKKSHIVVLNIMLYCLGSCSIFFYKKVA